MYCVVDTCGLLMCMCMPCIQISTVYATACTACGICKERYSRDFGSHDDPFPYPRRPRNSTEDPVDEMEEGSEVNSLYMSISVCVHIPIETYMCVYSCRC